MNKSVGIHRFSLRGAVLAALLIAGGLLSSVPAMAIGGWADGTVNASLLAPQDKVWYGQAFRAAGKGHWDAALRVARNAKDDRLIKALEWMYFQRRGNNAGFHRIAAFLANNPTWPRQQTLRQRAEEAMNSALGDETVLAWFAQWPPVTGLGQVRLAEALLRTGNVEEGLAQLRDAWVNNMFTKRQSQSIYRRHKKLLRPEDHVARLDVLLWNGHRHTAKRMLGLVSGEQRRLAEARLALMTRSGGVDAKIRAVPKALRSDPGLTYERVRWRRRANLDSGATDLLLKTDGAPGPRADKWWLERSIQTRKRLQAGKPDAAYRLASDHGLPPVGADYAEAEWLSGWIALRFMSDSEAAYVHFARLYDAVTLPVSLARAAYWAGRAAADHADRELSGRWYKIAAQYPTTFYGQLAAEALAGAAAGNGITEWQLPTDPKPDVHDADAFTRQEQVIMTRLLAEVGQTRHALPFLRHMSDTARDPAQHVLIARLAMSIGRPDFAVRASKSSVRAGVPVFKYGYPLIGTPEQDAERALVLSIARQESEFNPNARSAAGARGLMQLMPATARRMARRERVKYSRKRLGDPAFNLRIGSALLGDLVRRYDGSYVLAIASYNAGTGRVRRWMRQNGDPRDENVDVLDWIERIPIYETRNYVHRVLENLQVYRVLLTDGPATLALNADLQRNSDAKSF